MNNKSIRLREMLNSEGLDFIMEAHDGISAKIVEQTGFNGIWASGLAISSALGVRDNNELSFKEVSDHLYYICSRVDIPVLLDMDTGYGTWEIALTALHQMERAGVAGVVIEDKKFPKVNSFLSNSASSLEDIDTYCNKIRALQDNKSNKDLVILTRIESFISGIGLDDAITRAKAYINAGSDGLVIHSKKSDSSEVDEFTRVVRSFNKDIPIIIIPTKYYKIPTKHFEDMGMNLVIWANHNIRASLKAMRSVSETIYNDQNLLRVESEVSTVREIFDIQGNPELDILLSKYNSSKVSPDKLIILGSTRGSKSLSKYTEDKPKCMIESKGKPIVSHVIDSFRSVGVDDISLVANYKKDYVNNYYSNDDTLSIIDMDSSIDKNSDISSVPKDLTVPNEGSIIISYGDLIINKYLAQKVADSKDDVTIVISDISKEDSHNNDSLRCYILENLYTNTVYFSSLDSKSKSYGKEFAGIIKIANQEVYEKLMKCSSIAEFVNKYSESTAIRVINSSSDELIDINSLDDMVNWLTR